MTEAAASVASMVDTPLDAGWAGELRGNLSLQHKRLYLWPLSIRNQNKAISVSASLGTSYRHER